MVFIIELNDLVCEIEKKSSFNDLFGLKERDEE